MVCVCVRACKIYLYQLDGMSCQSESEGLMVCVYVYVLSNHYVLSQLYVVSQLCVLSQIYLYELNGMSGQSKIGRADGFLKQKHPYVSMSFCVCVHASACSCQGVCANLQI
jgi:hypothetical protein